MKNLFYLLFVLPLIFSCGDSEDKIKNELLDVLKMSHFDNCFFLSINY